MLRKVLISATVLGALAVSAPALAGNHSGSTSGWSSTSGGCRYNCNTTTSGGHTSTSGNTTSTSSGTQVPEPGMVGLFGAGLLGLGAIQLRRRKALRK